ncbi:MAG: hypothetical protein EBS07_09335, partial [Sphingobacteriia bacterium]|nr:hypothetical protein [Sphingobacteriia bacterium]
MYPLLRIFAVLCIWVFILISFGRNYIYSQITASDCSQAVPVCTNQNFVISPNGFGAINELTPGSVSNPGTNPASGNGGCLLTGEQNSTWILVNINSNGLLEFSFGAPGPVQCYDWILWRYTPNTCAQILNNQIAPLRCNWNSPCNAFTGMATNVPLGGNATNFEPPLPVLCNEQYLICFSNFSSVTTNVPLNFFGSAQVVCNPITVLNLSAQPNRICQGGSTVLNASGLVSYTWSPAAGLSSTTGSSVIATPSSTTTYTVVGTNNCVTRTDSVVVTVIPRPVITVTQTNPTRCVNCDGAISVTLVSGTPPVAYSWTPSGPSGPNATGLCPDTYTVTVSAGGCTTSRTIILPRPYPITWSAFHDTVDCNQSTGVIGVNNINGAVQPFTFSWGTNPIQTTMIATGLPTGAYGVRLIDANGCRKDTTLNVYDNTNLSVSGTNFQLPCGPNQFGTLTSIVTGGIAPYSYQWNTSPIQTTPNISGLGPGNYTLTVTDAVNCIRRVTLSVSPPPTVPLTTTFTNVSCPGARDGTATVVSPTQSPNYTLTWNSQPVQTTWLATGLPVGTYQVNIIDLNNCIGNASVTISNPTPLNPQVTSRNVTCPGGNNGSARATIVGNPLTVTYLWNTQPAQSTPQANNLSAGTYQVIISNRAGCNDTLYSVITQPPRPTYSVTATPATCVGASNGILQVSYQGNYSPFSYTWNTQPVQSTFRATGLPAGTWRLTVMDDSSCVDSFEAVVTAIPDSLRLGLNSLPTSCPGVNDGSATVSVLNRTGFFQFNWQTLPMQVGNTATQLPAGPVSVFAMDPTDGCVGNGAIFVGAGPPLQVSSFPQDVNCAGGSNGTITAIPTNGVPNYAYSWNTFPVQSTSIATGLTSGIYQVIVTDGRGCRDTVSSLIAQPTPLSVTTSSQSLTCFGIPSGVASATVSGGVPGYYYSWNTYPVQTTSIATGLAAGTHVVTVSDANGCISVSQVVVTQPPLLGVTTSFTIPLCYGGQDAAIQAQGVGGTPGYTYEWQTTPIQSTQIATGIRAGSYQIRIVDSRGCYTVNTVNVLSPTPLQVSTNGVDLTCAVPPENGIANVMATGGTPPYTYLWNGGNNPIQAYNTGFSAGTWTVR